MSRSFTDAMPLILDHGSADPRKRAKTHGANVATMPGITDHGMEGQYGTSEYPFINSKSPAGYQMQSDNAIDSSAVNPVVNTILWHNPTEKVLRASRGNIIEGKIRDDPSTDDNHEGMQEWEKLTELNQRGVIMVLAEDVQILANTSKVISVVVYGPCLINVGPEGQNGVLRDGDGVPETEQVTLNDGTTYTSSKSRFAITECMETPRVPIAAARGAGRELEINPIARNVDPAITECLQQGNLYKIVDRENTANYRVFTYANEGPMLGSHYIVLHPTVGCEMEPVYGVYDDAQ